MPVSFEDVRAIATTLPRTTEGVVRGRPKLYVGRIVYIAWEREGIMGFAHPREWREAAVESEPDRFLMPTGGDLRYNWLIVRLGDIDAADDARSRTRRVVDGRPAARRRRLPGARRRHHGAGWPRVIVVFSSIVSLPVSSSTPDSVDWAISVAPSAIS